MNVKEMYDLCTKLIEEGKSEYELYNECGYVSIDEIWDINNENKMIIF